MIRRTAVFGAALALCSGLPVLAGEPLKLEIGKPLTLACQTQSIVIKDNGPAPTKGSVSLRLELKATTPAATGSWAPVATDDAHNSAFATSLKQTCAAGCPMTLPASGEPQLWAPAPKSLDKLGADEILLLAVIKPDTLALKASTFRGQSIEALENGTCTVMP